LPLSVMLTTKAAPGTSDRPGSTLMSMLLQPAGLKAKMMTQEPEMRLT
jgi:hypothetical protein